MIRASCSPYVSAPRWWGVVCLFLAGLVGWACATGVVGPRAYGQGSDEAAPRYVQSQWTIDDGLPVNSVNDIAQTEDGYLWLATFDGLVRFDGMNFKVYRSGEYEGLPSSRILTLLVRPDGIWMHTESWNVVRFHEGTFTTVAENVDLLYEDPRGKLWAGTERGVLAYRDGAFRPVRPEEIQGDVRDLLVASDGTLWVGTSERGLYRRTRKGRIQHLTTDDGLHSPHIWTLTEDRNGDVWIGVGGGVHRWREGQLTDVPVAETVEGELDVLHVEPAVGNTCLAVAKRGLFRCEDDRLVPVIRETVSASSFASGLAQEGPDGQVWINAGKRVYRNWTAVLETETAIRRVFVDREGNAWVGTASNGLFRLRPSPFTIYGEPEGLASGNIYPIEQRRDGSVWLGTLGGGVARVDPSGTVATYRPEKNGNVLRNVWALHEDRSGRLWMSGAAGRLCQFEEGRCARPNEESPIRARVRALYEDRRGRLWAGSESGGLFRCDSACLEADGAWTQFTPKNSDLPHPYVRTIHETPEGAVWVGTNGGGIARYTDGTFETLTTQDGLSSNLVRDIYQDTTGASGSNVLWVVTEDQGLNRVELSPSDTAPVASVTVYRKRNGLYDNVLHQILKDDQGRFWLSSNRGIFWVRKAELEAFARGEVDRVQSISYTTNEGLRSREANGGVQPSGLRAQDGRLWFPTQEGAGVVDPATISHDVPPPSVHIEAVASGDSVVARRPDGPLHLAAAQRSFDVEYTGIRLANPEAVEFRYRLKGLQSGWRTAGRRRQAFFTNVPPGQYSFQVAAQVRGGDWSKEPAALSITVAPFWWETWWFYGLCVVGLGLLGYGGFRYRLYALRRRQEELSRQVKARTEELEEAREEALTAARAKSQFLANMSHEIRTPMNGILGFADLLDDTPLTADQQEFVDAIQSSGTTLLSIINDILDVSKLEAGEVVLEDRPFRLRTCVEEALEALATEAAKKGLEMAYLIESDVPPVIRGDETRFRQVLLNLLSNAVKFTEEGEVVLHVQVAAPPSAPVTPCELHVSVRDTGIGIPEGKQERLFESFSQADASTTREHGGTGLGLSISRRIVDAMGGRMWVDSEEGVGSTFHFTMEAEEGALPDDEKAELRGEHPSLADARALVVENHETNRALLLQLTERWGMDAVAVASGTDALDHLDRDPGAYDVLILDAQMSDVDGSALMEQIRETDDGATLPVLMLGSVRRDDFSDDVGPTAWVRKPIKQSSLSEALTQALGDGSEERRDRKGASDPAQPARRVLLAEDDTVNQTMMTHLLGQMGHETDVVATGSEALDALRTRSYDLVLMDVQMPEMDGLEATRRIRDEWPAAEQPHIIALTAAVTEEDRERCRAAGMNAFLSKPVQRDDLAKVLARTEHASVRSDPSPPRPPSS